MHWGSQATGFVREGLEGDTQRQKEHCYQMEQEQVEQAPMWKKACTGRAGWAWRKTPDERGLCSPADRSWLLEQVVPKTTPSSHQMLTSVVPPAFGWLLGLQANVGLSLCISLVRMQLCVSHGYFVCSLDSLWVLLYHLFLFFVHFWALPYVFELKYMNSLIFNHF